MGAHRTVVGGAHRQLTKPTKLGLRIIWWSFVSFVAVTFISLAVVVFVAMVAAL